MPRYWRRRSRMWSTISTRWLPGAGSWAGLIRRVLVMGEVENIGLCVTHSLQIDTNVIFQSVCSPLQFSPLPIIFAG